MSSSSSGLTRRRGLSNSINTHSTSDPNLNAKASSPDAYSPDNLSPPSSSTSNKRTHSPTGHASSTISTYAGSRTVSSTTVLPDGTRVAWDPDEIMQGDDCDVVPIDEPAPVPHLTLMEQVLLLGIKDRQGYLSFWNDSLSYVLRGTIIMELALRGRIAMVPRPDRRRLPLAERPIQVIDSRPTGETLLDEALRLIRQTQDGTFASAQAQAPTTGTDFTTGATSTKHAPLPLIPTSNSSSTPDLSSVTTWLGLKSSSGDANIPRGENWGVGTWMDMLSGETWNILRVSYQLRQVRERLAKGLVDKGVLRTERRSFVIFDMATHPVADQVTKDQVALRVFNVVRTAPKSAGWPPGTSLRDIALVASAQAGNVLENVLVRLPSLGERETAWARADEIMVTFSKWAHDQRPDVKITDTSDSDRLRRNSSVDARISTCKVMGLDHLEVVAAVMSVFARMDSLL